MVARLLPPHREFPAEMGTIGRLLTDYGELEFSLMHCISMVRDDMDATLKSMFRVRSEAHRINIADAWGRGAYHKLKLGTQFEMMVSSMRHCLSIRNQFAHCHWHIYDGKLCFIMLEELAKQAQPIVDLTKLTYHFLDLPMLDNQAEYFLYTEKCISYLNYEGRLRREKIRSHDHAWPGQRKPPEPYILPDQ